ncbi:RNA-guided endonuclease InsQ/TnpB family protein [Gloeobacter violaceus]|nr:RNA-guided endonuclease TnpB family protein [Gloeobacter violaceus]
MTYQYRLKPTAAQSESMERWLQLLCKQYNYRLAQRFDWMEHHRCSLNACSIRSCSIATPADAPDYSSQKRDLRETKKRFPEYAQIYSQVLQDCIGRVKKTFDRFVKNDTSGNRSGRPRFKSQSRYRSFTYPQILAGWLEGNRIRLPKLGCLKIWMHRPLPPDFAVKTATITRKADHWYIAFVLENKDASTAEPVITPTVQNTTGFDLGLESFLVTDKADRVEIPHFHRRAEARLARLHKRQSRTRKGSSARRKANRKLSRAYQKVVNQRKDFHYKTAWQLIRTSEVIAHEDLTVQNMARTNLAKSIYDAGWSTFIAILTRKAANAGVRTIAVNPAGTTLRCSRCDRDVPKQLSDRWHECACGIRLHRDHNAAINIRNFAIARAVGHHDLVKNARRSPLRRETCAELSEASAKGRCHEPRALYCTGRFSKFVAGRCHETYALYSQKDVRTIE